MPPADDEQRRHEMAASSESPNLQPPIPPTRKPNHPNPIPIPIPLSTGLEALNNNADLLTEILLRLPAKYLIRLKSVCKKWRSLISSDYFCHQHTLRHPKLQPSLILRHSAPWSGFDYFYWNPTSTNGENVMIPYTLSVSPHYQILQACNGLLLLRGLDFDSDRCTHLVYNPTTKQSTKINPTYNDEDNYVAAISLAFDPSISPYYKIVCILRSFAPRAYKVVVYDSETHLWELSLGPFSHPSRFCFRKPLYWNNAVFWWCPKVDAYYRFDIAKNEMKTLSFPPPYDLFRGKRDSYLQELDGNLYYLTLVFMPIPDDYDSESMDLRLHKLVIAVWKFEGDGNSEWLLKHHLMFGFGFEGIGDCVGLMGHSDNVVVVIHHHFGQMKAYNFLRWSGEELDKSREDLVDFTAPPFDYADEYDGKVYHVKAFQFGETLALV